MIRRIPQSSFSYTIYARWGLNPLNYEVYSFYHKNTKSLKSYAFNIFSLYTLPEGPQLMLSQDIHTIDLHLWVFLGTIASYLISICSWGNLVECDLPHIARASGRFEASAC
jgi:hypothetical protein